MKPVCLTRMLLICLTTNSLHNGVREFITKILSTSISNLMLPMVQITYQCSRVIENLIVSGGSASDLPFMMQSGLLVSTSQGVLSSSVLQVHQLVCLSESEVAILFPMVMVSIMFHKKRELYWKMVRPIHSW